MFPSMQKSVCVCQSPLQTLTSAEYLVCEVTYLLIKVLQLLVVKQFIRVGNMDSHCFCFL